MPGTDETRTAPPVDPAETGRSPSRPKRTWSITIARVRGIPIRLHLTFVALVGVLAWRGIGRPAALASWVELTLVGMIFASVVLHELGHALAAHRHGVATTSITLYPFGGLAQLDRRPPSAAAELEIAAAGPMANLALAAAVLLVLLLSGGEALHPGDRLWLQIGSILLWANLIMAGINLVPAFPMDGGRILRSLLARRLGWIRATIWSASIGQVLAVVLIIFGLTHSLWWVLAGLVILPGANLELRRAHLLRALHAGAVSDVMARHVTEVSPRTPAAELAELSRDNPLLELVVIENGRAIGFLPSARLWAHLGRPDTLNGPEPEPLSAAEPTVTFQPGTGQTPVADLMQPIGEPLVETTHVTEALQAMREAEADAAPVISEHGELVGVITRSALIRVCQRLDATRREAGEVPWTRTDRDDPR